MRSTKHFAVKQLRLHVLETLPLTKPARYTLTGMLTLTIDAGLSRRRRCCCCQLLAASEGARREGSIYLMMTSTDRKLL